MTALTTAASTAGNYLHWGVLSISVTNALIIVFMIITFVAAILLPLGPSEPEPEPQTDPGTTP
jgi:hypothetical protein